MLIPDNLKKGDAVIVIAPSSPILEKDREYIEKSKTMVEGVRFKGRF